jgi:hypothetical protein
MTQPPRWITFAEQPTCIADMAKSERLPGFRLD